MCLRIIDIPLKVALLTMEIDIATDQMILVAPGFLAVMEMVIIPVPHIAPDPINDECRDNRHNHRRTGRKQPPHDVCHLTITFEPEQSKEPFQRLTYSSPHHREEHLCTHFLHLIKILKS